VHACSQFPPSHFGLCSPSRNGFFFFPLRLFSFFQTTNWDQSDFTVLCSSYEPDPLRSSGPSHWKGTSLTNLTFFFSRVHGDVPSLISFFRFSSDNKNTPQPQPHPPPPNHPTLSTSRPRTFISCSPSNVPFFYLPFL